MINIWTLTTANSGIRVSNSNLINTKNSVPIIGLYNPINSNTNIIITNCYIMTSSEDTVVLTNNCWGVISTNNYFSIKSNSNSAVNNSTFKIGGSVASTFDGYSGNAILYSIPTLLRYVQGIVLTTTDTIINQEDNVNITCYPGSAVGIYVQSVPGSPPTITASITWQEVPIGN